MLPPDLLNNVNKELKARADALGSQIANHRAVVRLEDDVIRHTEGQIAEAKQKLLVVQSLAAKAGSKAESEAEAQGEVARAVEKLRADLAKAQGHGRDQLQRVAAQEARVEELRSKLHAAEDEAAKREMAVLGWLEDNKAAHGASSAAAGILTEQETRIATLRRESELLVAKARRVEGEMWEGRQTLDQLTAEIAAARRRRVELESERRDAQRDVEDATARELALREVRADAEKRRDEMRAAVQRRRAEADAAMAEQRRAEAAVAKAEREVNSAEAAKNRAVAALEVAEKHLADAETEARLALQQLQLLLQRQQRLEAERRHCCAQLEEVRAASEHVLEKRARVEKQLAALAHEASSHETEALARFQVIEGHKAEVDEQLQLLRRGAEQIHKQTAQHMHFAREAETRNSEITRLRKLRSQADRTVDELRRQFEALASTVAALDADAEALADNMRVAEAAAAESSVESRMQRQVELEELQAHLETVTAACRQSRRAVDDAAAFVKASAKESGGLKDAEASLRSELAATAVEIERLQREGVELADAKQRAAELAEDVFWRVEAARMRADSQVGGIAEIHRQRNALRCEAEVKEAELQASIGASRVELHAHEDDRHEMVCRLQAARQQERLVQARHSSLMDSIERMVPPGPRLPKHERPVALGQVGCAATASLIVAEEQQPTLDELHARHLLHRATERDELQQRGDRLDEELVRAERDLRQLDAALAKLRAGRSAAMESPTLLIEGFSDAEATAEERFLWTMRERLSAREAATQQWQLEGELAQVARRVAEADERLESMRAAELAMKQRLEEARTARDCRLREVRARQREGERLGRLVASERSCTSKTSSALRTRAGALSARAALSPAAGSAEAPPPLSAAEVLRKLQQIVVRAARAADDDSLYFRFRRLLATHGLAVPQSGPSGAPALRDGTNAAPAEGGAGKTTARVASSTSTSESCAPPTGATAVTARRSGSSSRGRATSATSAPLHEPLRQRPATQALVAALGGQRNPSIHHASGQRRR